MAEIVPAINVSTFDEVVKRIKTAEKRSRWIHIDVADGSFTPEAVWHNASDLVNFETPALIEIHFMVNRPEDKIFPWLKTPAQRIIFHIEATKTPGNLVKTCRNAGKEAGISICPDSSWEELALFVNEADLLQTLAVHPGPSGQEFDRRILEKLKKLRVGSRVPLEVDGGVSVGIARECRDAGADFIVVGSSLFTSYRPFEKMLADLEHDIAS